MSDTEEKPNEPGERATRRHVWFRRVVCVAGAAALLFVLDRVGRLAVDRALEIPGARVAGASFGAHAAVVAAAGLVLLAIGLAGARVRDSRRGIVVAIAAAAIAAVPGVLVGRSLASGDWIARQSFAPALRWGAPVAVAAAVFVAARLEARLSRRRARALAWAAIAAGASLADALVLPGLYAGAHLFLYGLSAFAALLCVLAWLDDGALPLRTATPLFATATSALVAGAVLLVTLGEVERGELLSFSPAIGNVIAATGARSGGGILLRVLEEPSTKPYRAAAERSKDKPLAPPPRSVILIVVDTLRGDALPPVRTKDQPFARAKDTPFLDSWLASTYRFRNAYAQASQTKRSMPPLFRSLEPFEDPSTHGTALPERMRQAGLLPIAVVPDYFIMPAQARSQELLHGFERVAVFEADRQTEMLPQAIRMLEDARAEPFFAWFHFYPMHAPYFSGSPGGSGPEADRYAAALHWLDGQLAALMAALDRLGLASTTLVVLAADHGEHIGEGNRHGHGDGVHEEELHVPLAFRIPGAPGAVVDGLAGNIDIVPTILDLLGQAPSESLRGTSLVPLMSEPRRPSQRVYYVQNAGGTVHGIIADRSKLVYNEPTAGLARYDRFKDPRDRKNLYGKGANVDRRLVSALVRKNPVLFAKELQKPEVARALEQKLAAVDPAKPPEHLAFLLKLAAAAPSPAATTAAARIFDGAKDADVRAMVAEHLFPGDKARWSSALERALGGADAREEAALLSALARRGQPAFGLELAARRIAALAAEPESPALTAWLHLTERWSKPRALFAAPFERVLSAAQALPPERAAAAAEIQVLTLSGIASMDIQTPLPAGEALENRVVPLATNDNARVARAACRALAQLPGPRARDAVLAVLADRKRDARVRQAALLTLAAIDGAQAVPVVLREAEDPALTIDAVQVIARLRDERGIPLLMRVARGHNNGWARKEAQDAIDAMQGGAPQP